MDIANLDMERLRREILASVETRDNLLTWTRGYQSEVYVFEDTEPPVVVKAPGRRFVQRLLPPRREYPIYRHLAGVEGVPRCFGLVDDRYLVLEHLDATPYRFAKLADRQDFFERLRRVIDELHRRGVAHGDLKKKENLLVVDGRLPYIIDFGTAVMRKPGWAPLSRLAFRILRQVDDNAWLKLKYDNCLHELSSEDERLHRQTLPERVLRALRRSYLWLRWPGSPPPVKERRPPELASRTPSEEPRSEAYLRGRSR